MVQACRRDERIFKDNEKMLEDLLSLPTSRQWQSRLLTPAKISLCRVWGGSPESNDWQEGGLYTVTHLMPSKYRLDR